MPIGPGSAFFSLHSQHSMTRRSASTYTASSTTEDVPPTTTNIRKMKTAAETFRFFDEHSRGITLFGGAALVLTGMVTITVQNKKDIEANKKLADKDIEANKALIEFNRELADKDIAATNALIEFNRELVSKDVEFNRELVSKDAELKAMKNMLLYGQSEEYKGMRESYASRDVATDTTKKKSDRLSNKESKSAAGITISDRQQCDE